MEKTIFIEFGNEKSKTRSIFIDSYLIKSVDELKYLGVRLNSQLYFEKLVDLLVTKLSKLIGSLIFTRQDSNLENCLLYYQTYIEPFLFDALIVYDSTNSNNLHTIFLLQKNFPRVVFGRPLFAHSSRLFDCSSYQTVHEFYASALIRFFFGKR